MKHRRFLLLAALALSILIAIAGLVIKTHSGWAAFPGQNGKTSTQSSLPRQRTLLATRGSIDAFAQDGGRIAWLADACPGRVKIRTLATGREATVGKGNLWGEFCLETQTAEVPFALGGSRVVWGGFDSGGNSGYGGVATSAPGERWADLEDLTWQHHFWGDYLAGAAGDGPTLVYATAVVTHIPEDDDECVQAPFCVFMVVDGGVKHVIGRTAVALAGAPPAVRVAVSTGRLALVPADRRPWRVARSAVARTFPRPAPNGPVEIREAETGAVAAQFSPRGSVTAVALADRFSVVLVQGAATKRIERRDSNTGRLLGSTAVPRKTANKLSIAGASVIYRVGREIRLLDAATGRTSLLAVAKATPVGLSIEGRRVAWAENLSKTRARIQEITLPE